MTGTYDALSNLADAYVKRGTNEARVRAKFAEFEKELEAAKQQDVDFVAARLVQAWEAGASVAATGRAMGTSNIYNARRKYYDAARAMQGAQQDVDNEFLERLYRQARGEEEPEVTAADVNAASATAAHETWSGDTIDVVDWVSTWTVTETNVDNVWKVDDPEGRVESIVNGLISGYPGNRGEFMKDAELHRIVHEIHGINTKEFD